jgi:hypothetical protein
MPTGACGINCDVCKLRLLEVCSTCGSGKSLEVLKKLEVQKRIFGGTCSILECAFMNKIEYCLRDCNLFPCDNFSRGPYPFAQGFLDMHERRRKQRPPALDHNGVPIKVPEEYWEQLEKRDINRLMNYTLFSLHSSGRLLFHCLNEDVMVDLKDRSLKRRRSGRWEKTDDPLLELVTLLYLNNINALYPVGRDIISPSDLKHAGYFQGRHRLKLDVLVERYGNDMDGFKIAAEHLEGSPVEMGDTAFMFLPFPRVPLYYVFWEGDEEFDPKISVLFDRSIEAYFLPSAIWALVNFVSFALLIGAGSRVSP